MLKKITKETIERIHLIAESGYEMEEVTARPARQFKRIMQILEGKKGLRYETRVINPNGHDFIIQDEIDNVVDLLYRSICCNKNANSLTEQGLKPDFKNAIWELWKKHDYWIEEYSIENGERVLNYSSEMADIQG